MPWIWDTFDEYKRSIRPVIIKEASYSTASEDQNSFDQVRNLTGVEEDLEAIIKNFKELGFGKLGKLHDPNKYSEKQIYNLSYHLIYACELLLIYNKRIPQEDYGDFTTWNILYDKWNHYKGNDLYSRVDSLLIGAEKLLKGHKYFLKKNEEFLKEYIYEMPDKLKSDFITCQNLFSLGLDEVGLLIASRGLETLLREIVRKKKIKLTVSKREVDINNYPLSDLIESICKLKWKKTGEKIINQQTKGLLHFIRAVRNSNAHSDFKSSKPRETVIIIAENAGILWSKIGLSKAQIKNEITQ